MRYFVAVLFLGLWACKAYAQQVDLSPPGLANQTAATVSCVGSPLFVFALMSIPVVFVVYYFASYLNIEKRARAEGKGSFFSDELFALMLSSLIVASFLYLIYQFWNYWGIPVKQLFEKIYLCGRQENCPLFLPVDSVLPETCSQVYVAQQPGFRTAFFFLLSLGSTFYKTFLVLLPLLSATAISVKNITGAVRDMKEKRYSYPTVAFIVFVDGVVIMLTLLIFTNLIYRMILYGIGYQELAGWWFRNVVNNMFQGG